MTFPRQRLKTATRIIGGGTPGDDPAHWGGAIPFVTPPDLRPVHGAACVSTGRSLTDSGVASGSSLVPSGSVLVSKRAPIGYVAQVLEEVAFNQGCLALVPSPGVESRFLAYALSVRTAELNALGRGSTFLEVSGADLGNLYVPLPGVSEQQQVADYLDRETSKINTLIEAQERFIRVLHKRRAAVVDRALESGVSDVVEERETGNPWIPVVPDGWDVVPAKHLTSFGPSNGVSPEAADHGGQKSLSLGAVRGGRVLLSQDVTKLVDASGISAKLDTLRLRADDILIVRGNGNVDLVGRAGLVGPEFADEDYIYPDLLMRVRVGRRVAPDFFVWAFNGASVRSQMRALARTAVGTFKVSGADVKNIVLPVPPLDEQRRIVEYLCEVTAKVDRLIAETERFIELSRKRRTALITAAVTGQIDVRQEVA